MFLLHISCNFAILVDFSLKTKQPIYKNFSRVSMKSDLNMWKSCTGMKTTWEMGKNKFSLFYFQLSFSWKDIFQSQIWDNFLFLLSNCLYSELLYSEHTKGAGVQLLTEWQVSISMGTEQTNGPSMVWFMGMKPAWSNLCLMYWKWHMAGHESSPFLTTSGNEIPSPVFLFSLFPSLPFRRHLDNIYVELLVLPHNPMLPSYQKTVICLIVSAFINAISWGGIFIFFSSSGFRAANKVLFVCLFFSLVCLSICDLTKYLKPNSDNWM